MAVSTTPQVATNCVISLDDAGGTLRDISGVTNKIDFGLLNGVAEWRVLGTQWMQRKVVGKDAEISGEIVMSTTSNEGWDILANWHSGSDAARTLRVDVPNSDPGSRRYEAEVVLEEIKVPLEADADDVIMISFTAKPHGAVTLTTIS